ncbi:MAG: fructose-bisphosphate aldolase, partial [Patescibacteria group bacterium]
IIKQKLPMKNGGYKALNAGDKSAKGGPASGGKYGKYDERMYTELASDHPIDLCRYQVANCYMGRIGLLNSGGESGESDMKDAVASAVINKRAGGMGIIMGRKAFQKPFTEGVKIIQAVQDVYLCREITVV